MILSRCALTRSRGTSDELRYSGPCLQMFDLPYFKEKPNVFYSFAKVRVLRRQLAAHFC